ncbi:hypothetical protein OROGR_014961 [Orobanche gracilis]
MRKTTPFFSLSKRTFSSDPEIPSLHSFLQSSIFSLKKRTTQPQDSSISPKTKPKIRSRGHPPPIPLSKNTDEAWKSFKTLTVATTSFPSKPFTNSLITHLSSLPDTHNLKRAFASAVFVLEKYPSLLEHESVMTLLESMKKGNTFAPAFALTRSMLTNWKNGSFAAFLSVFHECCRIALDEKVGSMSPDFGCLQCCVGVYCREVESVVDAEKAFDKMSFLVRLDSVSFGLLAYLYAVKGLHEKVIELEGLICRLGVSDKSDYLHNVVCGYVNSGNLELVSTTILRCVKEG